MECPPEDLKIEEEWGPEVLDLRRFLLLLLKDPDIQMACEATPNGGKIGLQKPND